MLAKVLGNVQYAAMSLTGNAAHVELYIQQT